MALLMPEIQQAQLSGFPSRFGSELALNTNLVIKVLHLEPLLVYFFFTSAPGSAMALVLLNNTKDTKQ